MQARLLAVLVVAATVALGPTAAAAAAAAAEQGFARVSGGDFRSVLPSDVAETGVHVKPFALQRRPVTNRDFLSFVRTHPEWQRGRVAATFAESHYLQSWAGALELGPNVMADQPVTNVSWFAARAFCQSHKARVPSWNEWELTAAADEHSTDARHDPVWRTKALQWFSRPASSPLPTVGRNAPNVYGVYDLHGLVWEWVQDFDALFAHADDTHVGESTTMSPGAMAMSCGGAALALADPENYPVILRLAMLSSLQRNSTTTNLGFRCARSATAISPPHTASNSNRVDP